MPWFCVVAGSGKPWNSSGKGVVSDDEPELVLNELKSLLKQQAIANKASHSVIFGRADNKPQAVCKRAFHTTDEGDEC